MTQINQSLSRLCNRIRLYIVSIKVLFTNWCTSELP